MSSREGSLQLYSILNAASELQRAIRAGDISAAVDLARKLAAMQANISTKFSELDEKELDIKIHVEDKEITQSVTWKLLPSTNFRTLKAKMYEKYGFLPELQKWIVGKRLVKDKETLEECGINFPGAVVFLYLLSKDSNEEACSHESVAEIRLDQNPSSLSYTTASIPPPDIRRNPVESTAIHNTAQPIPALSVIEDVVGWACPKCTLVNKPTRPGCEACAEGRPADYVVPEGYHPSVGEQLDMEQEMERYTVDDGTPSVKKDEIIAAIHQLQELL